jgi:hypothetical protein
MATGRIGVTPVLRTRWSKLPTTGTTVLSGLDDNSVALVYDAGYEAVYRNGVLLSRGNDYTATNGTTVTLVDATLAGDVVEIFANDLVPLTDAISKGQYNAKGALLSATAASTPAVLPVGTNDQVLTADSSTSTGLKWATAAAGGMTLISTTNLSGTSVTLTSIPSTYKNLFIVVRSMTMANAAMPQISFTSTTQRNYGFYGTSATAFTNATGNIAASNMETVWSFTILINDYANSNYKGLNWSGGNNGTTSFAGFGGLVKNSAINDFTLTANAETFTAGTIQLYGVS